MWAGSEFALAQQKKKKKRKLTPFGKFLKYSWRTIVALSAVIVTLAVVWTVAIRPPEIPQPDPTAPTPTDAPQSSDEPGTGLVRKKTYYTFLLAAFDQQGGSTDTMMVASYDAVNHTANMVSIPRDTMLDRRVGKYHYYRLNGAYVNGEYANGEGGGIKELRSAVSAQLGIPIDYYAVVDLNSFVKIVDAVGGVDFDVPVYMDYYDPTQNLKIYYEKGMHYGLTGQQVMEIARCRKNTIWHNDGTYEIYDTYPDGDIGRNRTQQDLMKAIANKLVSWNNWNKILTFIDIFNESVETNLSVTDMAFFGQDAIANDALSTLSTATIPGVGDVRYQGQEWLYQYDVPDSLELINTMLNPYTTPITEDMVTMLQVK